MDRSRPFEVSELRIFSWARREETRWSDEVRSSGVVEDEEEEEVGERQVLRKEGMEVQLSSEEMREVEECGLG